MLSLFTACAPWLPLDQLLPELAAAGFAAVEIGLGERRYDPSQVPSFWGNNAAIMDWSEVATRGPALRGLLETVGLRCSGIGSYCESDRPDRVHQALQLAELLGAPFVRVRAPWCRGDADPRHLLDEARRAWAQLTPAAAAAGVALLVEIHDGSICASASGALRLIEDCDPRWAGVILDPGNWVGEGLERPAVAIGLLGERLRHVHVKDKRLVPDPSAAGGLRWKAEFTSLGAGDLDWPAIAALLQRQHYRGSWSIENFSGLELGPARLRADAAWLAELLTLRPTDNGMA